MKEDRFPQKCNSDWLSTPCLYLPSFLVSFAGRKQQELCAGFRSDRFQGEDKKLKEAQETVQ